MRKSAALLFALVLPLVGCQSGSPRAAGTPSPALSLRCASGDNGVQEAVLGWGFCYPAAWHAIERQQKTDSPKGVDATFDITDYQSGADLGKFGYMIISTDDRAGAPDLKTWVAANIGSGVQLQTISWGNALEAAQETNGDGRRFALTPHQVVVLELRSGAGNLDLETAMSARLDTWKFIY